MIGYWWSWPVWTRGVCGHPRRCDVVACGEVFRPVWGDRVGNTCRRGGEDVWGEGVNVPLAGLCCCPCPLSGMRSLRVAKGMTTMISRHVGDHSMCLALTVSLLWSVLRIGC